MVWNRNKIESTQKLDSHNIERRTKINTLTTIDSLHATHKKSQEKCTLITIYSWERTRHRRQFVRDLLWAISSGALSRWTLPRDVTSTTHPEENKMKKRRTILANIFQLVYYATRERKCNLGRATNYKWMWSSCPEAGGEGQNHTCEGRMSELLFLSRIGYDIFCQVHFLAQYDKKSLPRYWTHPYLV
jgi:hypothetical protein